MEIRIIITLYAILIGFPYPANSQDGTDQDFSEITDYQIEVVDISDSLFFTFRVQLPGGQQRKPDRFFTSIDSLLYYLLSDSYQAGPEKNDILFFIHGMWGSRGGALERTLNQLKTGIIRQENSPVKSIVSLSWPANVWQYKDNKQTASKIGIELSGRFLNWIRKIQVLNYLNEKPDCKIHLLTHSLGNYFLIHLMHDFNADQSNHILFDELIMAAPDLDLGLAELPDSKLFWMHSAATRIHIYFNRQDLTLKISKDLNDQQRLGLVGLNAPDEIDSHIYQVDVTGVSDDTNLMARINKHHYYRTSPTVMNDFVSVLRGIAAEQIPFRAMSLKSQEFILVENRD